ncbi:hypothetical protein SeMB42_g07240 [Synchytrium endobioticum]|uniref:DUF4200 domain-containing protein n=1 Tax=Synchytrium endobioticum TaxID=286115 RepID=A0A507CLI6_9FUNG|nr:hypothetical protein SeMB42_g07240 [Synchytrium endobioticum]TPX39526.1 hypothetical protein SeLEV6574_g07147 [Synchytrium endobioticum]
MQTATDACACPLLLYPLADRPQHMMAGTTDARLENYFRANVERKVYVKPPEPEDFELTPATRLLETRRQMMEVEAGLVQQKQEHATKMAALLVHKDELKRREAQLKDSLVKFEKFIKESDQKRIRALKKSLDERGTRHAKEQEISQLKDMVGNLTSRKSRQTKSVETNVTYQRYLESVQEAFPEFGEVRDIIVRFDTLMATNTELADRAHAAQEASEKERAAFARSCESRNNMILSCNNDIAKLQSRLEDAQRNTARWQAELDHAMRGATEKSLVLGQVKLATANLFNLVRQHLNGRLNSTSDTLIQMDRIGQFILDLSQITQDAASLVSMSSAGPNTTPTAFITTSKDGAVAKESNEKIIKDPVVK